MTFRFELSRCSLLASDGNTLAIAVCVQTRVRQRNRMILASTFAEVPLDELFLNFFLLQGDLSRAAPNSCDSISIHGADARRGRCGAGSLPVDTVLIALTSCGGGDGSDFCFVVVSWWARFTRSLGPNYLLSHNCVIFC